MTIVQKNLIWKNVEFDGHLRIARAVIKRIKRKRKRQRKRKRKEAGRGEWPDQYRREDQGWLRVIKFHRKTLKKKAKKKNESTGTFTDPHLYYHIYSCIPTHKMPH